MNARVWLALIVKGRTPGPIRGPTFLTTFAVVDSHVDLPAVRRERDIVDAGRVIAPPECPSGDQIVGEHRAGARCASRATVCNEQRRFRGVGYEPADRKIGKRDLPQVAVAVIDVIDLDSAGAEDVFEVANNR